MNATDTPPGGPMSQRSFLIRGSVQAPDGALRPGSADAPARITSHPRRDQVE